MADVEDTMVVSGNGNVHDAVQEQFSNHSEDESMEIIAKIPNYNCETKEGNGGFNESSAEKVEESNELDGFKVLKTANLRWRLYVWYMHLHCSLSC